MPKPVTTITTIDNLKRERSELHPQYMNKTAEEDLRSSASLTESNPTSNTKLVRDAEGEATINTNQGVCHFSSSALMSTTTVKLATTEEERPRKLARAHTMEAKFTRTKYVSQASNISLRIENVTRGESTDADFGDFYEKHDFSAAPLSINAIHVECNEEDEDDKGSHGFDNPCFNIEPHKVSEHDLLGAEEGRENGGFENLGYMALGTPTPIRASDAKVSVQVNDEDNEVLLSVDALQEKIEDVKDKRITENESVDAETKITSPGVQSKTLEEDFDEVQIQSASEEQEIKEPFLLPTVTICQEEVPAKALEESVPESQALGSKLNNVEASAEPQPASIVRPRPRPSRSAPNMPEAILPLPVPGLVGKPQGSKEEQSHHPKERYYMPPPQNSMYPVPLAVKQQEESRPKNYIQACYDLTGSGVVFPASDASQLATDSSI